MRRRACGPASTSSRVDPDQGRRGRGGIARGVVTTGSGDTPPTVPVTGGSESPTLSHTFRRTKGPCPSPSRTIALARRSAPRRPARAARSAPAPAAARGPLGADAPAASTSEPTASSSRTAPERRRRCVGASVSGRARSSFGCSISSTRTWSSRSGRPCAMRWPRCGRIARRRGTGRPQALPRQRSNRGARLRPAMGARERRRDVVRGLRPGARRRHRCVGRLGLRHRRRRDRRGHRRRRDRPHPDLGGSGRGRTPGESVVARRRTASTTTPTATSTTSTARTSASTPPTACSMSRALTSMGTSVSSVIAAAANGVGITGVAPDARIMGVRFLVSDKCDTDSYAVLAIQYAIDMGAKSSTPSWGGPFPSPALGTVYGGQRRRRPVRRRGRQRRQLRLKHWPAASDQPNLVSVGAIDPDGAMAAYSNYGAWSTSLPRAPTSAWPERRRSRPRRTAAGRGRRSRRRSSRGPPPCSPRPSRRCSGTPGALRSKLILSGWKGGSSVTDKTAAAVSWTWRRARLHAPGPAAAGDRHAARRDTLGTSTAVTHLVWPLATDASGIDWIWRPLSAGQQRHLDLGDDGDDEPLRRPDAFDRRELRRRASGRATKAATRACSRSP